MQRSLIILFSIILYFYHSTLVFADQPHSLVCEKENLELKIYNESYKKIKKALDNCQQDEVKFSPDWNPEKIEYAKRYYKQESNLRDVEIEIYQWQIFAANVILILVIILTVIGLIFSGFQLWYSQRLSKLPSNLVEIELSISKLKLQTSMIGVAILAISYAFLLVFTKEIYQIRAVASKPLINDSQEIKNSEPPKNLFKENHSSFVK